MIINCFQLQLFCLASLETMEEKWFETNPQICVQTPAFRSNIVGVFWFCNGPCHKFSPLYILYIEVELPHFQLQHKLQKWKPLKNIHHPLWVFHALPKNCFFWNPDHQTDLSHHGLGHYLEENFVSSLLNVQNIPQFHSNLFLQDNFLYFDFFGLADSCVSLKIGPPCQLLAYFGQIGEQFFLLEPIIF